MRGRFLVVKPPKSYRLVCLLLTVILASSALTFIQFVRFQPVYAEMSNKAMIAYGEATVATPRYREWDGSALGSELTGPSMAAEASYVVLKSCPIDRPPSEKMLVVSEDGGDVYASVWDSTTWGTVKTLGTGILIDATCRGFDVAYEQSSGDCIIVVRSGADVKYWIWGGSSWIVDGATLDLTVTTGNPVWIRLAADPLSDEIAMIWLDDTNRDVGGAIWSGSAWGSQQLLESDDTVVTVEMLPKECIEVEYMANNGEAMFVWGADNKPTTDDCGIGTRVWNGASWEAASYIMYAAGRDNYPPFWLSLKANPSSNELMLAVTDDDTDLGTIRWSGSAWDSAVEHSTGVETEGSRCADVEWENVTGHTTHAIVSYGVSGADELSTRHWNGASWGLATTEAGAILTDVQIVQLRRSDADGKIFGGIVDGAEDLHAWYWNPATSAWVATGSGLGEIETSVSAGTVYEPFEIAPDTHAPQDFSVSADPTSLDITLGTSDTSTINVTSLYGFSQTVALSVTSDPITGVTTNLDPTSIFIPANDRNSSTLTVSVGMGATVGDYTIRVNGTWSTITHHVDISLSIKRLVTISVEPDSIINPALTPEAPLTLNPDGDGAFTDWSWKTLTIKPVDNGTFTSWTGYARDWDDWPNHDGDTTSVFATQGNLYESSALEDHTSESWTIAKVEVTVVARMVQYEGQAAANEEMSLMVVIGGTPYTVWVPPLTPSYRTFTAEWTQNPDTTSAWTWSDIDALEAGVKSTMGGGEWTGDPTVTQLYVVVCENGAYTEWDEYPSHNGDTDYASSTSHNLLQSSTLDDAPTIHPFENISRVKVTIVARTTDAASDETVNPILAIYDTFYFMWWEFWGNGYTPTTTYQNYTTSWSHNPSTGDFWTWSDIDDLQAGAGSKLGPDNVWTGELRVTQLYVEVMGPRLDVNIRVENVEDLWLYNFELSFNPDVLQGVWYDYVYEWPVEFNGDLFLGSDGGTAGEIPGLGWNNTIGKLWLTGAYVEQKNPTYCPDGNGTLAIVSFEVIAEGETEIHLGEETGVMDYNNNWIMKGEYLYDGYFRNIASNLIPTASFSTTPVGTPVPLEGYETTFKNTSTPASGSGSPITTCKWYFWRTLHETLSEFPTLLLRPESTGTYTGWTGTYTHWDDITPDGDGSYVYATANNLYESSNLQNHATQIWNIGGVRVTIVARTNGITDEQVQLMLVIGTTAYLGTNHDLTNSYQTYGSTWTENPATSSAWTWSDIDALEAGVKSVQVGGAWTGEIRVTQLYIEVIPTPSIVSSLDTITRNYTMRGTWNITLTVIDDDGVVGTNTSYVTILAHDVAITGVTTNTTLGQYPRNLYADIDQIVEVNVTATNQGDFPETIDLTCYWSAYYEGETHNGTIGVGTQYDIELAVGVSTTRTFLWDTKGRNISNPLLFSPNGNASVVQYEYDSIDNEYTGAGVRIRYHDVAVTVVTTNATGPIQAGDLVEVEVTVVNQGDFNKTTISVTAYYETTTIDTQTINLLSNRSFSDLEYAGTNHTITLTFDWNTEGVSDGTYTISANATWTNWITEDYEPYDNTYIDGDVIIGAVVPEFPFGAAVEMALIAVVIYIWWKGRRRTKLGKKLHAHSYQKVIT